MVYRDVGTRRDGNVQAMGDLRKDGALPGKGTGEKCVKKLCSGLAGNEHCLSSCSHADNTAWKDVHLLPPSCPEGEPAATWFLPAHLLCQLFQDGTSSLIFPLLPEGEGLTIAHGNLEVSPWLCGEQDFALALWSLCTGGRLHTMQDSHQQQGLKKKRVVRLICHPCKEEGLKIGGFGVR